MWNGNEADAVPDFKAIQLWLPFMPRNPEKMRESLKELHKTQGLLTTNEKIFN